jgi:hypothetical protein
MRSRIFFAAIVAFWVTMNFLLWRSQEAAHSQIGSAIPVDIVWDKILTAPDDSSLDIYNHDKKAGFCQWTPATGNAAEALNQSLSEDYAPNGLTPQPSGYGLSANGNVQISGTNRAGFEMQLRLSTNQTWQDLRFTAKLRPTIVDVHAIAAARKILIKVNGEGGAWQRALKFSDFQHPELLLQEFGLGDFLGFAEATGLPLQKDFAQAASGLQWRAHEDWMQFGHSKVRVYRLETEFLGQHLSIFTSRVGEILWVDAPYQWTLRNEAFSHL